MKNFIVFLLFFVEFILLSCFIGFIWYLADNGMPFAHVHYLEKMTSVLLVVIGLAGPATAGIFVGNRISKLID
jgi:hypothetical protein